MGNPLFIALLLFSLSWNAKAQTVPASGSTKAMIERSSKTVLVCITARGKEFYAIFDTDGQSIAELSESELNKKFANAPSAAAIVNFMVRHGYRVQGFATTQARTHGGTGDTGGGSNGYALLFEELH